MLSNATSHIAISQYPRPSDFPSQHPDSDRPRLKDIKIMGYSLRKSHFRYTIWIEFNVKTFKRSKCGTEFGSSVLIDFMLFVCLFFSLSVSFLSFFPVVLL